MLAGERDQLRIVVEEDVQAVLDVEPARDAGAEQLDPRRRKAAALRRYADERRRRPVGERVVERADDRHAVLGLSRSLRVEDRDHVLGPVTEDAPHRLPVVRVAGEALSEDQVPRA